MTFDSPQQPGPSPINDLSYRNYDGPLRTHAIRWWVVALANFRLSLKKKGFWIVLLFSALPYVFFGLMKYVTSVSGMSGLGGLGGGPPIGQVYASVFYQAFEADSKWLLLMGLLVGAGSIANDNQANAMLVYLSKPLTKGDYLLGKWMSIFLMLFITTLLPAMILYAAFLGMYVHDGFLHDEPWLIVQIIVASAIPATLHASLLSGISAWSKSGRMAGAVYAGIYFVTWAATGILKSIGQHKRFVTRVLVGRFSVSGVSEGLAQKVYGVTLETLRFGGPRGFRLQHVPPPPVNILLPLFIALCVVGVLAARARIRAVEVVRG